MRIVAQRCKKSSVSVAGEIIGEIDFGLVLLVGFSNTDTEADARYLAEKVANLRIFDDESGKMNDSVKEVGGSVLSVSQFTLYGDTRKGRRPNFMAAAQPDQAEPLYRFFNETLREMGIEVQTGQFGAMMEVNITNDGPVTLILES